MTCKSRIATVTATRVFGLDDRPHKTVAARTSGESPFRVAV